MRRAAGISLGMALGLSAAVACAQGSPGAPPKTPPRPTANEGAVTPTAQDPKAVAFFETKIRPLLAQQCFGCHSGAKPQGALTLDKPEAFFKGAALGPTVVPGDPDASLLIQAVRYTRESLKMPPAGKLKPQAITDLTTWVKMGAVWPEYSPKSKVQSPKSAPDGGSAPNAQRPTPNAPPHWAFQPVRVPNLPAVKDRAWVKNPVDAFVLSKLEAKGLKPAPPADARTLIRRVTFDLTGLPPTAEDVEQFVKECASEQPKNGRMGERGNGSPHSHTPLLPHSDLKRPSAYERLIDRLLASPAYGARWARHWLDVARYADSNGLDENTAFGNAWRYRDYVVNALNQDKPYDQFVREQIAGDLLPPSGDPALDRERLTATGFLCLGPKVLAEPDKAKMVMDIVDEQIDTVGKSIMGLTLGCARCHNHKFDPIPTQDYYSLAGIFKSTRTMQTLSTVARVMERPLADQEAVAAQEAWKQKLAEKQRDLAKASVEAESAATNSVLRDLPKYLLVGLEADVAPYREASRPDLTAPGLVLLEAEKFQRGDVKVTLDGTGQGIGIIESAGRTSAFTEYDLDLAQAGDYQLSLRYASGEERPINVRIDGETVKRGAAPLNTGGFDTQHQEWHGETVVKLAAGKHVLRIDQAAGALPHVDKIALSPLPAAPPSAPGSRPRTGKVADLARANGLDPEILARSAGALLAVPRTDPIWGPWRQLSELPTATFAADAAKLLATWKSNGELQKWYPPVAARFGGPAFQSLEEVAGVYGGLLKGVNDEWLEVVRGAKKTPKALPDGLHEKLRHTLYGPGSVFGLEKAERLYPAETKTALTKLKTEVEALQKNAPAVPMVMAVEESDQIGNVKVHIRGNTLTLGEEAPRRFLRVIAGENQAPIPEKHSGRLELAEWLTRPDHPLTARVLVNRVWQHHFGEGIVRTPDNFGRLGEAPTHPELLDWLASRFVAPAANQWESGGKGEWGKASGSVAPARPFSHSPIHWQGCGWSLKKLHRLILLSNAYQMSAAYDAKAALADPENRLLWRFNRQRLEVEAIRDSMLAVSGKLDSTMGGSLLTTPDFGYVTNDQSGNGAQYDSPRRSLYLPVIRNAVFDVFQVFDFVEPSLENGRRSTTTVAPQALFLLNGQFVLSQSKAFAEALLAEPGDDAGRVKSAYLKAYGRPATAAEVTAALGYVKGYEDRLAAKEPDSGKRAVAAWASLCQILFASNEFVYVN